METTSSNNLKIKPQMKAPNKSSKKLHLLKLGHWTGDCVWGQRCLPHAMLSPLVHSGLSCPATPTLVNFYLFPAVQDAQKLFQPLYGQQTLSRKHYQAVIEIKLVFITESLKF